MTRNRTRTFLLVLLIPGLLAMSNCAAPSAEHDCGGAFAELTPIDPVDGLFLLIDSEFAETVDHCATIEDWAAELQARPEVVGAEQISGDEAAEYLGQACALRRSMSNEMSAICAEALAREVID
jgi:hypothetical protein